MLDYLEYLNVPTKVALAMVIVFFVLIETSWNVKKGHGYAT